MFAAAFAFQDSGISAPITIASVSTVPEPAAADQPAPQFKLRQRILLLLITWAGFLIVRLIGPTLRLAISFEEGAPPSLETRPLVLAFWHSCIFPAIYIWRNLAIRVLSSDSFD